MAKHNNYNHKDELGTIIGYESVFEGKLSVKHSIRVDGYLKGELISTDTVTIGSQGVVEGDIKSKDVIIGGKVKGSITAAGKVILESTSQLSGDLKTVKLIIEEGAILNGATEMGEAKVKDDKKGAAQEKK